jgi:hypothetical protein
MKVALPTLDALLQRDVLEVKFTRRRPKANSPPTRRMLCTNSATILSSRPGVEALNFRSSIKPPKYNAASKNLLLAWDIFKQDYRMINCDNVVLISQISGDEQFWEYFNDVLRTMSAEQKMTFFDV